MPDNIVTIPLPLYRKITEHLIELACSKHGFCPYCSKRTGYAGVHHASNCNLGKVISEVEKCQKDSQDSA